MRPSDFRVRLFLAAVLPSLLMAATLGVFWWNWSEQTLESALRERVEATAKQFASSTELPLFSGDVQTLLGMVESLGEEDVDLLGVTIANQRGNTLVHHGPAALLVGSLPGKMQWSMGRDSQSWRLVLPVNPAPVYVDDMIRPGFSEQDRLPSEPLGYVVLDVSIKRLTSARDKMLMLGGSVIVISILLNVALMVRLARGVVRPLARIIKGVEAMGKGDLDTRIESAQCDVLMPLANVINQMAEGVKLTQVQLQHRIDVATLELREAKSMAEKEARVDPLTGLNNRRAFMEHAAEELIRARRYGTPLSLAMIDLDHFKKVNDRWGHAIGDQVLIAFADILRKSMRTGDVVARVGGEEFVLLMIEAPLEEAVRAVQRIRKDVEAASLQVAAAELHWTASFGVTTMRGNDDTVSAALVRADNALYRAKADGRNQVAIETDDVEADNVEAPVG